MEKIEEWFLEWIVVPFMESVAAPIYRVVTDEKKAAYVFAYIITVQTICAFYLSVKLVLRLKVFSAAIGIWVFILSPSTIPLVVKDIFMAIRWIIKKMSKKKANSPQTLDL